MKEGAIYFDSSALVKRYVDEPDSDAIEAIWPMNSKSIVTSSLTYAELYATFYRLNREGRISKKNLAQLCYEFESDWRTFSVLHLTSEVLKEIPPIIAKVALRGADLAHIASVQYLRKRQLICELVTFDARMRTAADDLEIQCTKLGA